MLSAAMAMKKPVVRPVEPRLLPSRKRTSTLVGRMRIGSVSSAIPPRSAKPSVPGTRTVGRPRRVAADRCEIGAPTRCDRVYA